jgi:ferredoxin-nitrite reductase
VIDAVDVFVGGKSGPSARPGTKILEDVPTDELPQVLGRMIPYLSTRRPAAVRDSDRDTPVTAGGPMHANP